MSEVLAEEVAIDSGHGYPARLPVSAAVVAALTTALWGTNPTALKIVLEDIPPMGAAGLRFGIAVLGVLAWCRFMKVPTLPRPGEGKWLLANGLFFIAQIATFTLGVYWGTASHSIVILHIYPLFVVILAHFLLGERASFGKVLGLCAAFAGIVTLFAGEWGAWRGTQLLGDVVQLSSAILLSLQIILLKRATTHIEPSRVVLWQMVMGAVAFLVYSVCWEQLGYRSIGPASFLAVLYQGVVIGALCFTIWISQIKKYSASAISVFGFIAPVVGVFVSTFGLHESLTPSLVLSSGMVAIGIIVSNIW